MPALPVKHFLSIIFSILLIFILLITTRLVPPVGMTLGFIFLFFGLIATSYTITKTYQQKYRQGKISLSISIRNSCLEISAIVLTMILAGLAGRRLSGLATGEMNSNIAKYIIEISVGLFVGWTIGLLIKHASSRLMKSLSGR